MNHQIIDTAADWWATLLRTPRNGDPLPDDTIEAYRDSLATLIKFYYDHPGNQFSKIAFQHDDFLFLDVDYHPCLTLVTAAEAAGLDLEGRLPIKTKMWIRDNRVEVSKGYGATIEVIYEEALNG